MRPLPAPRMRSDQWVFNRRPSFTLGEFNGTVFFSAVVADLHLSQSIRLAPIPLGSPVRAAGRLCGWRETQRVPMTGLQRLGAGSSTRLIPSLPATRDHDHELRSGTGGYFDAARWCARAGRGVLVASGMPGGRDARVTRVAAPEIGQHCTELGQLLQLQNSQRVTYSRHR